MTTITTTPSPTLLQLAGADLSFPQLGAVSLVLIDLQNEYLTGPLALPGADAAVANAANLLARARNAGATIFHVAHRGKHQAACSTAAPRAVLS